jgi:hypothetical protein
MNRALALYCVVATVMSVLNLVGIFILRMVQDGALTFSGIRGRTDWLRVGYPIFVNAIGQAVVWPLSLPLGLWQLSDWLREGPPSAHISGSFDGDTEVGLAIECGLRAVVGRCVQCGGPVKDD